MSPLHVTYSVPSPPLVRASVVPLLCRTVMHLASGCAACLDAASSGVGRGLQVPASLPGTSLSMPPTGHVPPARRGGAPPVSCAALRRAAAALQAGGTSPSTTCWSTRGTGAGAGSRRMWPRRTPGWRRCPRATAAQVWRGGRAALRCAVHAERCAACAGTCLRIAGASICLHLASSTRPGPPTSWPSCSRLACPAGCRL